MEKKIYCINTIEKNLLKDRNSFFEPLTVEEINIYINQISSGWHLDSENKYIEKEFFFSTYQKEIDFVVHISQYAEKINHHPDLILKYKIVIIRINTHNLNAITLADFVLAINIDKFFKII